MEEPHGSSDQSCSIGSAAISKSVPDSEVVDSIDSASATETKGNCKTRTFFFPRKLLSSEKASFQCEWNLCTDIFTKMEKFLFHVAEHVASYQESVTADGYLCSWRECIYASQSKTELDRHIYFHAYHTKIKAIGKLFMGHYDFQCKLDNQNRNVIPEIPANFHCFYKECNFPFLSAQDFYWHVHAHARSSEEDKKTKTYICEWEDCMKSFPRRSRLIEHMKSHSQEKVIGCPQCGSIFGGMNRFYDHCLRSLDSQFQKYRCSHCKTSFAAERLLREHVRRHINHFKCPLCEMTCPTKSSLENHVKYRHTEERPFSCPECKKGFKIQCDLLKHLATHSKDSNYGCFYEGCGYCCRCYQSYVNHIRTVHEGAAKKPYRCHICDLSFQRGGVLTIHLKTCHDFDWPAGHSRFRYSKGEDGFYRIQTTRLESMELAQLMISQEQNEPEGNGQSESIEQESNYPQVQETCQNQNPSTQLESQTPDMQLRGKENCLENNSVFSELSDPDELNLEIDSPPSNSSSLVDENIKILTPNEMEAKTSKRRKLQTSDPLYVRNS